MTDARFVFEPVYDLRSARVCGYEILPRRQSDAIAHRARAAGWTPRQVAEVDAGTVVSALALARGLDPAAPVQVDVAADTVVLARARLRGVLDGRGVAPLLEIGPAVTATPLDDLVEAVDELRAWGFRIALDGIGRSFGLAMIDAMRPDVVKLESAGLGGPPVVRAVCEVAAGAGTRVAATGVVARADLVALHAAGVGLAQGPLLGAGRDVPARDPDRAPELLGLVDELPGASPASVRRTDTPTPRPRADGPAAPDEAFRHRAQAPIRMLGAAAVTVPDDASADTVRATMAEHTDAGGVVLVDDRHRPTGYLNRSRFLLAMAGPFGHALFANKPAHSMADPPRVADERTPPREAMELSLSGDPGRGYDDLVLVGPDGACTGVVAVSDLWRSTLRRDPRPSLPRPAAARPAPVPAPLPVAGSVR